MGLDRREFLKVAGLAGLLGLGGKAAIDMFAPGELEASVETIPLTAGKRWAMVIDVHKIDETIIKKCVEACHREHNVPDLESKKEEIKWIWKEDYEHSFPERHHEYVGEDVEHGSFLLLCNHCSNPPCCRVCPTKATWQREDGIVMMDQHRCIGCRFCMAACPFGARSFNWGDPRRVLKDEKLKELNPGYPTNQDYPTRSKGVVEKCTFCAERLAKGQLPACVEAANTVKKDALVFGDLDEPDSNVRAVLRNHYTIRRKPELGTNPNVFYIV